MAAEHLVDHGAESEQIAARVGGLAFEQFRRGVRRDDPGGVRGGTQFQSRAGQHDQLGRNTAVDLSGFVDLAESFSQKQGVAFRIRRRNLSLHQTPGKGLWFVQGYCRVNSHCFRPIQARSPS